MGEESFTIARAPTFVHGAATDDDTSRVQWCQSRARAMRWSEEAELLQEEMCRVSRFFDWHAGWWLEQQGSVLGDAAQCQGPAGIRTESARLIYSILA
ncbi:hypothetical protein HGRIS_006520 [Hohenbuehelia grisea]|uniref:Uncharacterized protein n=1 Tax=Hohenbuehelia grisea TaxID=104357 RepID=A0ABR3J9R4_9AGAR